MQDNAFTNKVKDFWALIKRVAKRVWEYLCVAKMEWIILVSVFAVDLISKSIVEATVDYGGTVGVIPYFLNIHRMNNYAAAFGSDFLKKMFGDMGARIFFSVFAVATSVALTLVLIKHKGRSKWFRVSLALFVAGAMGNCIDRMTFGYVRDFIEFVYFGQTWFGRQTWYVFNIADAALVAGVIMIIIYFLFMYRDTKKKESGALLTDELGEIDPEDVAHKASADAENSVAKITQSDNSDTEQAEPTGDGEQSEQTEVKPAEQPEQAEDEPTEQSENSATGGEQAESGGDDK